MPRYSNFSKYHTAEEVLEISGLFTQAGIPNLPEHEVNQLDKIYLGESLDPFFVISIPAAYFEKANALLFNHASNQLENIHPGYYLLSLTNEQLQEVVLNTNDWNHFDRALAVKLLADRNSTVPGAGSSVDTIGYVPYRLQLPWIILAYILTILFSLGGIILGLITLASYRMLSNGQRVPLYDNYTLLHAKIMIGIGSIRLSLFLAFLWLLR